LINVPVGIVSVVLSARLLPADMPPSGRQAFDFRGLALLGPGLALLVYGLSQAGEVDSFAQPKVWPTILIAVVLLALFVLYAGPGGSGH
jgi:hypothetical protein